MNKKLVWLSNMLSLCTTIFTIWYMHFGVPYKNSGALSKIGLSHHLYFSIWGILTYIALALGIILAYRKITSTKIHYPLLVISGIGMLLTLTNDFDFNIKPDYYLHCIGSLAFSVINGITVFILFAINYKKDTLYKTFTYITGGILIMDLICLLIFKETGLIEALPIFAGYLLLGITNTRSEKIGAKR